MILYRLKSNTKTIVEDAGGGYYRTIWNGYTNHGFLHRMPADNLIPLTDEEAAPFIEARAKNAQRTKK